MHVSTQKEADHVAMSSETMNHPPDPAPGIISHLSKANTDLTQPISSCFTGLCHLILCHSVWWHFIVSIEYYSTTGKNVPQCIQPLMGVCMVSGWSHYNHVIISLVGGCVLGTKVAFIFWLLLE